MNSNNETEQKAPKITKESVKKFTDEELDKVAGGIGIGLPCPDARCTYINHYCQCPDDDL